MRFIKYITAVIALLLTFVASGVDRMRFIMISDVHAGVSLGAGIDWLTNEIGTNLAFISTNFLATSTDPSPLITLMTGDNCDDGRVASQFTYFNIVLTNLTLNLPSTNSFKTTPGNHDFWDENATSIANYQSAIGYTNSAFVVGNYKFIGIATYAGEASQHGGQISSSTLDWLELQLTNSPYNPVIFTHYPVDDTGNSGWKVLSGLGLERLTNILYQYNVPLYLHGHWHYAKNPNVLVNGRTRQICMPSLCYGLGPNPTNAFNVCEINGTVLRMVQYTSRTAGYPIYNPSGIYSGSNTFTVPAFTNLNHSSQ